MAWSPKAADSREAGYIYANRYVSKANLRLQKRSGPYISLRDVLQRQLLKAQFATNRFSFEFSCSNSFTRFA